MRNQLKRIGLATAAALLVGGGVLGFAPAASAASCAPTDPYHFFGGGPGGAGWGTNGVLESQEVVGTTLRCTYRGENWVFVPGQGSVQQGTAVWTKTHALS